MVVSREITSEFRKEATRLFWLAKGHLIPEGHSEDEITEIYDIFLKRAWYNTEAYIHEEGFNGAYERRLAGNKRQLEKNFGGN